MQVSGGSCKIGSVPNSLSLAIVFGTLNDIALCCRRSARDNWAAMCPLHARAAVPASLDTPSQLCGVCGHPEKQLLSGKG